MKHYENDFLSFIDTTLDFANYVNSIKMSSKIYFIDSLTNEKILFTKCEEKGRLLLKMVYDNLESGRILLYVDDEIQEFTFTPLEFKIQSPSSSIGEKIESFSLLYEDFVGISEKTRDTFLEKKDKFIDCRNKIIEYPTIFDVPLNDVSEYLDSYYRLLIHFLFFDNMQQREMIHSLLFLDTFYDDENRFTYSFWFPLLFEQIKVIEKELDNYKVFLSSLDKSNFMYKIKKNFSWNLLDDKGEISVTSLDRKKGLQLYPIDDKCVKSIGKRTARFFEKKELFPVFSDSNFLKYSYFPSLKKKCKYDDYIKVAVMGEVDIPVIEKLYDCLLEQSIEEEIDKPIIFEVYSNRELVFSDKYCNVINTTCENDTLKRKSILKKVIADNDFLIVFDSYDLHNNKDMRDVTTENYNFIRQYFLFGNIENEPKKLQELILFVSSFYGKGGMFCPVKEIDIDIIEFLVNSSENMKTSLFLFLNDTKDYASKRCKGIMDNHYIESKNQCIDEYFIATNLDPSCSSTMNKSLNFSLYDFYRFIFLEDTYFSEFLENNKEFLDINISIDYSKFNCLKVYYSSMGMIDRDLIYKYLEQNFIPYFNSNLEMQQLIGTFFYNVSSNSNDLLFTHMFLNNKYEIMISQEEKKIAQNQTYFSYKWLYDRVIKGFDISAVNYIGNIDLEQLISALDSERKINEELFYETILDSCKQLGYDHSYLGEKCYKKVKKQ